MRHIAAIIVVFVMTVLNTGNAFAGDLLGLYVGGSAAF